MPELPTAKLRAPPSDFMGVRLNMPTLDQLIDDVIALSRDRSSPSLITYLNAHCVNLYHRLPEYKAVLQEAAYVYADGMSVVKAARRLGLDVPERLSAAHFFDRFCECCAKEGLLLYFLGSTRPVVRSAAENLRARFPQLKIIGWSHGHFELGHPDEERIIAEINSLKPDVLIVGMGVPRQEVWLSRHRERLNVPAAWCVGAMFEYFAGARTRAPRWMQEHGLEWLFRLLLEPRRLGHRYLLGNVEFLMRVRRALKEQNRQSR
jgi:N-acetylglucosaminyldiphosphoundecaprenol N-acetyl-beta-D-mannosaminyltransferase